MHQKGMKESLRQRYSLLRFYYTELYKSSKFGTPTVRHPMYDWPEIDEIVHDEISFMIGKHVRVIANFEPDDTTPLKAYIPKGRWIDYQTYNFIKMDKGKKVELYNGWNYTNVHIRGGSIVPIQNTTEQSGIKNTYGLLQSHLRLLIVPDDDHYAEGNLFVARGETTDEAFQYYTITYLNKQIQFRLDDGDITDIGSEHNEVLEEIHIIDDDDVLEPDFACAMTSTKDILPLNIVKVDKTKDGQSYLKLFSPGYTLEFGKIEKIILGKTGIKPSL